MKLLAQVSLAALVALSGAAALPAADQTEISPLDIKITSMNYTMIKATITNTGSEDIDIFNRGNFLDKAPVEKLRVTGQGASFTGLRIRYATDNLDADSFTELAAGESKDFDIDVATLHDLSAGGPVDILAKGTLMFGPKGSRALSRAVSFKSNLVSLNVDGARAARVTRAVDVYARSRKNKRTKLATDCTSAKKTASSTALTNCASLAKAAASAAASGSASKFQEYFKTTDATRRKQVANRFTAVAKECSSPSSGSTETHCTDTFQACESNVLAYTLPSRNYVVNCQLYFDVLPALTKKCHNQDQATTTLHEMTHNQAVVSPYTDDLGYGYSAATRLSATDAFNNADTYALYANAIYAGC